MLTCYRFHVMDHFHTSRARRRQSFDQVKHFLGSSAGPMVAIIALFIVLVMAAICHTECYMHHAGLLSHRTVRPMSSLAAKYNAKDSRPEHGTNRKSSSRDKGVSTRHSDIMQQKVGRMLRDELSDIIASGDIKANVYPDERLLRGVTIDDIDFASDLTTAKVSLSILGNSVEKRQVYVWLCNNIGQVRFELSQRLRDLRRVPEIRFTLVDTQSAQYLNSVLDEIAEANSRSGGGTGSAGAQPGLVDFEEADDAD